MKFLDINTFYYNSDGGVKTFYRAKMEWFKDHPEHQYYLITANSHSDIERIAPNIHLIQAFGLKGVIGRERFLLIDFFKVLQWIVRIKPDVIEAGDPLFTSEFTYFIHHFRLFNGMLSCFHHSDPIATYVEPWAKREDTHLIRKILYFLSHKHFYHFHRHYPYTLVSSQTLKKKFTRHGIKNISVFPFGVQDVFIRNARVRRDQNKSLLFAGRLEHEKGIRLIKKIIPRLLEDKDVLITIMGKGKHEDFFKNYPNERLKYLGYISDYEKVEAVYRHNNIFLALGPFETFGIGVLEALSSGMIVVGPDAGGTGELLASMDSPFIFKAGSAESFYMAVKRALGCDFEKESERSIRKSKDFESWSTAIGHMIDYYEKRAAGSRNKVHEEKDPHLSA
jgi:glycosyltransferase involved in cell wall biosynthesis